MNLPSPLQAYFEADRDSEPARLLAAFGPDAVVLDEGRTYQGHDAIAAWRRKAKSEYAYAVEPLDVERQDDRAIVRARVTGTFPGSPVTLIYRFRIADGLISALEIMS